MKNLILALLLIPSLLFAQKITVIQSGTNVGKAVTMSGGATINNAGAVTLGSIAVGNVTGMGTGVATWLATPTSANLAAAISDETGTGLAVFATSPTLITPVLGAATATSISGITGDITGSTTTKLILGAASGVYLQRIASGVVAVYTNGATYGSYDAGGYRVAGSDALTTTGLGLRTTSMHVTFGQASQIKFTNNNDGPSGTADSGFARVSSGIVRVTDGTTGYGALQIKGGASTDFASAGGTMSVNTTTVGNVGIGEDDLMTYAVPASTLGTNGDQVDFEFAVTIPTSINAKRIKIKFGATTILDTGAGGIPVSTAITMHGKGKIIRTGATTQKCIASISTSNATLASYVGYSTAAETLSGAVTLKLTGEAVDNNDIVQETLCVEWKPNNT